ncbi:AMP-binding protein [Nonomuraea sp. NPDC051191]|uniref:AMP-binding protein n=1 Tax=Nonomuraea sp. NPDC051191 TaxID=3364372 RepID=UPI0037BAA6B0
MAPPAPRLVHHLLDDAEAANPDGIAVRDAKGRWSYRQVAELSHAVAAWLADAGVEPGDRIIVRLPNVREVVPLLYGASRRGAVFVPLNPGMKAYHLRSVLEDSAPKLVIGDGEAMRAITDLPVYEIDDLWQKVRTLADQGRSAESAQVRAQDVAVLMYTSGSTAAPKAVVCPHAQVTFAASAINAMLGYGPDDVVFCRSPMSFDYGLYQIFLSALGNAELVLAGDGPDLTVLRRIQECGATVVPVVPSLGSMLATLGRRAPGAASAVRMVTSTGAALPAATIDGLRECFPGTRVVRMYGVTECKRVTIMEPELDRERPDSVGRALPGTRVLILGEDGTPCPPGTTGEIVVIGPNVMAGYWRAPTLTARTYRPDGSGGTRLHTGDYGHLDEDGYLYFEGRRDDTFKRRGTRMSTTEIEAAALDIPGVRAAAALPPHGRHDLALLVEGDLEPHIVLRELVERLESAKVPALCRVLPALPLTLNGKNERTKLARLLEEGRE